MRLVLALAALPGLAWAKPRFLRLNLTPARRAAP